MNYWVRKEILYYKKYIFLLLLNLVLGVLGFLTIDSFKASLEGELQSQSKQFLSADLSISTRRRFSEQEIKDIQGLVVQENWQSTRMIEFFSMVTQGSSSRLIQVKGVEKEYPFYGSLELSNKKTIAHQPSNSLCNTDQVWAYPELLNQMGLKNGESITLGQKKFLLSETVEKDSTQTFRLASFAPKVYVCLDRLNGSGLIDQGSTLSEVVLIKIAPDQNLNAAAGILKNYFTDASIRIETSEDAADDSVRTLKYLTDYLGLVSLVALFLSCLGMAFILRSFLKQRTKGLAIAHALGVQKKELVKWYFYELFVIGTLGFLLSLVLAYFFMPIFSQLLKTFTPVEISISLGLESLVISAVISYLPILLIGYPFAEMIKKSSSRQLFQDQQDEDVSRLDFRNNVRKNFKLYAKKNIEKNFKNIVFVIFSILLFWSLAFWSSKSLTVASSFVGIFLLAIFVIACFGMFTLKMLSYVRFQNWTLKHGILSLVRMKGSTLLAFICLSGGTLLMSLIPQLKTGLQAEIQNPKNQKLPSLFLFDIQEEQIGVLQDYLKGQNIEPLLVSPMVRARILKLNDKNYERAEKSAGLMTREEENDMRMRNRGVNLSYRSELSYSEEVVVGRYFPGKFDSSLGTLPELSIEERYADRMDVGIGDTMTFDIQGVEMVGKITSIRKIRWNTFLPNFFIQFQPGAIEEAPKTYITALSQISGDLVNKLQSDIVRRFPNVSIVDVKRLVESILDMTGKMSWALQLMAALSLFVGFLIMGSIIQTQVATRKKTANLFKILGASRNSLFKVFLSEFLTLSVFASLLGSILSLSVSFLLSYFLFESIYKIDWMTLALTFVFINFLSLLVSSFFIFVIVREKPITLIQEAI